MIVISDTSPLLYLFLIDQLELLPQLYTQVMIPEAVRDEMLAPGTPAGFQRWAITAPQWLIVKSVTIEHSKNLDKLDAGEKAAICLAKSLKNSLLLIDEKIRPSSCNLRKAGNYRRSRHLGCCGKQRTNQFPRGNLSATGN